MTASRNPSARPALPDRARPFRWGYFAVRAAAGRGAARRSRRCCRAARRAATASATARATSRASAWSRPTTSASRRTRPRCAASRSRPRPRCRRCSWWTRASRPRCSSRFAAFQEKALAVVLGPGARARRARARSCARSGVPLERARAPSALAGAGPRAPRAARAGRLAQRALRAPAWWPRSATACVLGYRSISAARRRDARRRARRACSTTGARRWRSIERRARAALRRTTRAACGCVTELAGAVPRSPTCVYDRAETEWRRVQAQGAVPAHARLRQEGRADRGRQPARHARRAAQAALARATSRRRAAAAREFLYPPVARMLLMLLFIAVFATYLRMELPAVYRDNAHARDVHAAHRWWCWAAPSVLVGVLGLLGVHGAAGARAAGGRLAAREAPGAGVHADARGGGDAR